MAGNNQEVSVGSLGTSSYCCVATVPNDRVAVVETCGKFSRVIRPGLNVVCCCIGESVAADVSMRLQQLNVICETKTKDNVFLTATVSVQFEVRPDAIYEAVYKLSDPRGQITAYVYDVVRSTLPKINLDQVFDSKDEIALATEKEVSRNMPEYGYKIVKCLVTDIEPDRRVKESMNEINAAARLRAAAVEKAEAQKILVVKQAEAEAESKYLQGVGVARQRQAIVAGLQQSVVAFTGQVEDVNPKDVLQLMVLTQYMDVMKELGQGAGSTVVFVPHNPASVNDLGEQVRNALMQASAANVGAPTSQAMVRKSRSLLGIGSTPVAA
jgi:regulator of protease activity HflC (stomatin/prohibitin superfamily)